MHYGHDRPSVSQVRKGTLTTTLYYPGKNKNPLHHRPMD